MPYNEMVRADREGFALSAFNNNPTIFNLTTREETKMCYLRDQNIK